jgi:hypothetical protein
MSASRRKDLLVTLVNGVVQYWVPCIKLDNGMRYYPPIPSGSWTRAEYRELGNGQVGFRRKEVAIRYAVIRFLMDRFEEALKPFLLRLLRGECLDFEPQRLIITPRLRDPKKMIVLYNNDQRVMEPMAICLELKKRQGVFALVDDFGRVLRDTCIRFMLDD